MHESSGWLLLIFASIAASILAQFFPKISENYVSMAAVSYTHLTLPTILG